MLVQSGKPVGVLQTHEWAPRVLIANSNLVGDWATWPEFRRLEQLGLTMYGQMTAGSWIYIGTQGILQGTYETFAAVAAKRFGGTLAGTLTLTGGCGGMGGAQPLAVTLNGGRVPDRRRRPARLQRRVEHRYLDEVADDLDEAVGAALAAKQERRACRSASVGNAATVFPELLRRGVRDRHRHRPDLGARPARATCPRASSSRTGTTTPREARGVHRPGPGLDGQARARRWSGSRTPAPRSSTTATRSATRPASAATTARSSSPASCPPTSGRCSARARARSAGWRSRATRRTSPRPTGRCSSCSPTTSACALDPRRPGARSPSRASRPASAGSATASATSRGWSSTRWSPRGSLRARSSSAATTSTAGSVASPYRETEAMADGSDAIADWPLLNALVNTASGASWVSIHHGGGVGIGRSIHAGQVIVADGTDARRREARAGADQRPRDGRHPARRRRLRHRRRGRRRARACASRCGSPDPTPVQRRYAVLNPLLNPLLKPRGTPP